MWKLGHFVYKCLYEKNSYHDEYDSFKPYNKYINYKDKERGKFTKKKRLYTKRDNNSSSEESENDIEIDKVLFMEINSNEDVNGGEESEYEGEVDLEAKLISTLKYLKKSQEGG